MEALGQVGQIGLLLVPMAVMSFAFVIVPVLLTQRKQWSAGSGLLAILAAAASLAFLIVSAQQADANPGGGAEGAMGTDVPDLLLPPPLFGVLALLTGARTRKRRATPGAVPSSEA
jgi:hypothetical protein